MFPSVAFVCRNILGGSWLQPSLWEAERGKNTHVRQTPLLSCPHSGAIHERPDAEPKLAGYRVLKMLSGCPKFARAVLAGVRVAAAIADGAG